jgi:hypothetical protein
MSEIKMYENIHRQNKKKTCRGFRALRLIVYLCMFLNLFFIVNIQNPSVASEPCERLSICVRIQIVRVRLFFLSSCKFLYLDIVAKASARLSTERQR